MGCTEHEEDDSATTTQEERNEYLLKYENFIHCARCKKFNTQFKQILSILWVS